MDIWLEKCATYGRIAENGDVYGHVELSKKPKHKEYVHISDAYADFLSFLSRYVSTFGRAASQMSTLRRASGRLPRAGRLMPGGFTLIFKAFVHRYRVIHKADVHISILPSSQASTSTQPGVYGQQGGCPPPARTLSTASTEGVHTLKAQPLNDVASRASKVKRKLIKK